MKRKISKKVTRIFATVLACIMVAGTCPVAFATEGDSASSDLGLFFDMDLTAYDKALTTENKGIFDSASDSVVEGVTVVGSPTVKSITGTGIKYLELTSASEAQGVKVADAGVNTADISMEFWTRSKITHSSTTYKMLFTLASSGGTNNMWIQSGSSANAFNYYSRPSGGALNMTITDYSEDNTGWHHVVVTRSVTSEGTVHTRYVDGNYVSGDTDTGYTSTSLPTDMASYLMYIGGCKSQAATWEGDIAVCRMYNTVLSEATVKANYNAEVGRFTAGSADLTLTGAPEDESTISTDGILTMTFGDALESTTVSGIRLLDSDYKDVTSTSAELGADGKTVNLTYSGLATESSYKLYIPGTVKSTSGVYYSGSVITLYTEATLPTCLFDLDMSGYDASGSGAKGLTDSVTDEVTETITVTGTPTLGAIAGRPVKYLSLADTDAISANDASVNTEAETAISFEMWTRRDTSSDGYQYKNFFRYWNGLTTSGVQARLFDVYKTQSDTTQEYDFRLLGYDLENGTSNQSQNKKTGIVFADDTWQHQVYTLATTSSGVELIGYIDGEKKLEINCSDDKGVAAYELVLTNFLMNVGGGLPLDLGALRAYDGIMSEAAAKQQYNAEKDNFIPIANALTLLDKPAEGSVIDASGTVSLRFNKIVQNYDGIYLKDADGATVATTKSPSSNGKVVNVAYSGLSPFATYTLVIPNTVTDADGSYFDEVEVDLQVNGTGAMIFSMDISAYNAESEAANKGIVDSVTDTVTEAITVTGAPVLNRVTDSGAPYLTFTAGNVIRIDDSGFAYLPSAQNMTLELWARNDGTKAASEHILIMRNYENTSYTNLLQLFYSSGNTYLQVDGDKKGNTTTADNTWEHFVISREYDSTASTYTWTLYLNGVNKTSVTGSVATLPTTVQFGAGVGYGGDIGMFNVYNTAMTAANALALYNETVTDYAATEPTLSYVVDSATVDEDGTVAFKLQNNAATVAKATILVAAYDEDGDLMGVNNSVAELTASSENTVYAEATHTGTDVDQIRVYVWNNVYSLKPLTGVISISDPYSL